MVTKIMGLLARGSSLSAPIKEKGDWTKRDCPSDLRSCCSDLVVPAF